MLMMEDLARAAGMPIGLVETLVKSGVIEPASEAGPSMLFPSSAIDRLGSVMRLRRDLGVNLAGAAVILEMRDHLRRLQAEVERLHGLTGI
jgi:chaperone modulatory protein CbpM